jgi:hypothetical protein
MKPVCLVNLGHYGDLINALPICKHFADKGAAVSVVCRAECANLFDGVSYARPVPICPPAGEAKVIMLHDGSGPVGARRTTNYDLESFARVGLLGRRDSLPIEFDRRDAVREAALLQPYMTGSAPIMLVATHGISSPFPRAAEFRARLDEMAAGWRMVILDGMTCTRIYDLLALLEKAALLVTIDTAVLHLAAVTKTPTIALTSDLRDPWYRTAPRAFWLTDVPYSQVWARLGDVRRAVDEAKGMVRP